MGDHDKLFHTAFSKISVSKWERGVKKIPEERLRELLQILEARADE